MEPYKSRKFMVLLYPDCIEHMAALEKVKSGYEHIYITHDKDVYTDGDHAGELKKSHIHLVIQFKNATWNSALAKELGIPVNYLQRVRNEEDALSYLIHYNEENKHQYSLTDCHGSSRMIAKLQKIIESNTLTESQKALQMIDVIDTADSKITVIGFARFAASADRWDVFRRSAGIFLKIIEEKNKILDISPN